MQTRKLLPLAAALATLSLSGCKFFSAGTDTTTGTENSEQLSIEKKQSMSDARTAKASTSAPGAQLVGMATMPLIEFHQIDLDGYARAVKYDGKPILPVDQEIAKLSTKGALDRRKIDALEARVIEAYKQNPVLDVALNHLNTCLNERTVPCFSDYFTQLYGAVAVQAATVPQVKPDFDSDEIYDKLNNERKFDKKELDRWLAGSSAILNMSVHLQPKWLSNVHSSVMRSQVDAQVRIVENIFATDPAEIRKLAERPAKLTARVTPDETGKPIRLVVVEKAWNLTQDEKGLTITKNGSIWHGDGQIAGGKLEVAFEESATNSADRSKTIGYTASDRVGTGTKAGVDLKSE